MSTHAKPAIKSSPHGNAATPPQHASSIGLWHWTIATGELLWSRQSGAQHRTDPQDAVASLAAFQERLHPDDRGRVAQAIKAHIQDNVPYDIVYRQKNDDGDYISIKSIGAAQRDSQGRAVRMAGSFVDISTEMDLRQKLTQKQHELEMVFNHVPSKIWLKDEHNRILRLNQPAAESMNVKLEDAIGADTYDLFPKFAKKYHDDDLRVINSGTAIIGMVEPYTPKDSAQGWVRTDKIPFKNELSGDRLVLVVSTDITPIKRAEEKVRRHAEALEKLNEDLDHFAYVASHDLKAPLRGMDNLTSWIEEDLGPDIDPDVQSKLHLLRGRVNRMENLLADILTYSRAGKGDIEPENVDTGAVLEEIVDWISPAQGFTVKIEPSLPILYLSRSIFHQIFLNLIGNAIKHHDRQSGAVTVSAITDKTNVIFTVEDDGPGIPEQFKGQVFQMFKKLESRDAVEGSGIGLAIVKKLVDALGGDIKIDTTNNNRGARFVVSIPLAHKEISI